MTGREARRQGAGDRGLPRLAEAGRRRSLGREVQWMLLWARGEVEAYRSPRLQRLAEGPGAIRQDETLRCGPVFVPTPHAGEPSAEMDERQVEAARRLRVAEAAWHAMPSHSLRLTLWLAYAGPVDVEAFPLIPEHERGGPPEEIGPQGAALCNLVRSELYWENGRPADPGEGTLAQQVLARARGRGRAHALEQIARACRARLNRALDAYGRARTEAQVARAVGRTWRGHAV